jgi:hypothetical protein
MSILFVSHSCATAINQVFHARIHNDMGWKPRPVVLRQLSAQSDRLKAMALNARKCVAEDYTWHRTEQMTGDAYREATKC